MGCIILYLCISRLVCFTRMTSRLRQSNYSMIIIMHRLYRRQLAGLNPIRNTKVWWREASCRVQTIPKVLVAKNLLYDSIHQHHSTTMNEVIPGLWIGDLPSALNVEKLKANNIFSILSAMRGRITVNEVKTSFGACELCWSQLSWFYRQISSSRPSFDTKSWSTTLRTRIYSLIFYHRSTSYKQSLTRDEVCLCIAKQVSVCDTSVFQTYSEGSEFEIQVEAQPLSRRIWCIAKILTQNKRLNRSAKLVLILSMPLCMAQNRDWGFWIALTPTSCSNSSSFTKRTTTYRRKRRTYVSTI